MSFALLRNIASCRALVASARRYSTTPPAKATPNWPLYVSLSGLAGLGAYVYLQRKDKATDKTVQEKSPFDPEKFKDFKLKEIIPYNHNTSRFIFELPDNQAALLPIASCVVVRASDPEALKNGQGKPVIRPYTPISPSNAQGYVTFLIKKYENGLMSKFIHNLQPGETLAIKGPILKIPYKINEYEHVGLIGGGTGITPLYQILQHALSDENNKTRFTLLFANVSERDILLREEFDALAQKFPNNFKVVYWVDKGGKDWKGETGYITKEGIKKYLVGPEAGSKLKIYICGPPPQVAMLAGKKDGPKQGEFAGELKKLGYAEEQVFKF